MPKLRHETATPVTEGINLFVNYQQLGIYRLLYLLFYRCINIRRNQQLRSPTNVISHSFSPGEVEKALLKLPESLRTLVLNNFPVYEEDPKEKLKCSSLFDLSHRILPGYGPPIMHAW